jgi:hypothetical protein
MKALPIGQYLGQFYAKRAFRILPAFVVFVSISVALYFIFRRETPWWFTPRSLLDLHCDIHFQPLRAAEQYVVRSSPVAVARRIALPRLAVAGFLSADKLAQKHRATKGYRGCLMILDLCNAPPELEQLPGQAERQNRKSV